MPINVEIIGGELLDRMGDFYRRSVTPTLEGIEAAAQRFVLSAEGRSKNEFLKGPRPQRLGHISGRLSGSVHGTTKRDGENIEAVVGSNVKYAARWELGFTGTENVRAHGRFIKKAFGKTLASPVLASVGSFSRRVDVKPRAFLSPAVSLELPWFEQDIAKVLGKELSPGGETVQ